jgi:transglutaminase-like putative cysteine protease
MHYVIDHETVLTFPEPVREHELELRLEPRADAAQRLLGCAIELIPNATLRQHGDAFGNVVHRASLVPPHDRVSVRLRAEVETLRSDPFDWKPLDPRDEALALERALRDEPRLHEFLWPRHEPAGSDVMKECRRLDAPPRDASRPLAEDFGAAMAWMATTFTYLPGSTGVHAPLAVFLDKRAGVCQDFAHLFVALVRSWGVPARYVTGYIDPGEDDGVEATHAWAEVFLPGVGWRGLDSTHGLWVGDRYVAVAVGRDSRDAAPLRGAFKGQDAGAAPQVRLRVQRQQQ